MTRYRYDVLIQVGAVREPSRSIHWVDWQQEGLTLAALRQRLQEHRPEILGIKAIPNARVQQDTRLVELLREQRQRQTVEEIQASIRALEGKGVDPETLWLLGSDLFYQVAVGWAAGGAIDCVDAVFSREGDDLLATLEVSMADAILGTTTSIDGLDGQIDLELRAGVQSGDVLTIAGRGVTPLRGTQRGDLRVGVQVVTPTKLDSAQRKLIEDFAKKSKAPAPKLAQFQQGLFSKLRDRFRSH